MSLPGLDGPRLAPQSGTARQLIVLVHGYGADGRDLIDLGRQWQSLLPDAAFVAPNAPTRVPGAPSGFQWFPITRLDPDEVKTGVTAAEPVLKRFLDAELTAHGLDAASLALVGFSQGTMLALQVGLGLTTAPAAILGYSGLLAHRVPQPPAAGVYPPVFLCHGDSDPVVPPQRLFLAVGALEQAGVTVQWRMARNVGHGIDPESLSLGGQFLKAAFAKRP